MKLLGVLAVLGVLIAAGFQNCAGSGFEYGGNSLGSQDAHHGEGYHCDDTGCHDFQPPVGKTKYYSQLGNADYIASKLVNIFTTEGSPGNSMAKNIIRDKILTKRVFFGGQCGAHDSDESCIAHTSHTQNYSLITLQAYSSLDVKGTSNASREGYRMQACDDLIDTDAIRNTALGKADISSSSPLNEENLLKLFQLFYPEVEDEGPVQSLIEISSEFQSDNKELAWTKLMTIVCYSSGWQYY